MKLGKLLSKGLVFIFGIVITLIITWIWNQAIPDDPILVKEVTDTVRVIHNFNLPIDDDSLASTLDKKLKNIKLLSDYENEISDRLKKIEEHNKNYLIPNLVHIDLSKKIRSKGFTYGNSNLYFTIDFPTDLSGKYIDFKFDFFNPELLKDIAFIRLNLYKLNSDSKNRTYVFNEFYEINSTNNNFVRIDNTFSKGKYEVLAGFTFKKDLDDEYPKFHFKRWKFQID